jgi:hypothetical protein
LLGVFVAAAVVGVSAVSFANTSPPARSSPVRYPRIYRRYTRISPKLKTHFALFRQVRTVRAADAQPLPAGFLTPQIVSQLQLDVSGTQFVQSGSAQLWVVPGAAGACVMMQIYYATGPFAGRRPGGGGCNTTAGVLQNGLVGFRQNPDGTTFVHGIVPDGNDDVTVTFADRSQQAVPVTSNVVAATFPTGPMTVSFLNANGVTVSLPYTPPTPPPASTSP